MSVRFRPHDYQVTAMDWIRERPYAGLLLDMGLGKTVIALTVINELLYDSFDTNRVLVIAPLKVAEDTWSRETAKWAHLAHLRISKVLGSEKERRAALAADADIYVINRENVVWLVETMGAGWNFDTVVVDELSSFKSHQAKRFRAMRKVRPRVKRLIGLTGTPMPNGYMDLWAEVYLLDRGERLGKTITGYRNEYFSVLQRPGFQIYTLRSGADKTINARIRDICLSMKASDYLKLAEPLRITVPVALAEPEMARYRTMERDAVLELGETEITAASAAAVTTKLLQLANGAVYDEGRKVTQVHDQKLARLEELVEEAAGRPVLVFYSYQHDRDRIKARLGALVRELKTPEDIRDWNDGKIEVLLAHPASCGHGLNLQEGGDIIVWFGLSWSLEQYQQANARLHRQGQTGSVRIYHLTATGTVDEDVLKVLEGKGQTQEEFLRALKARIAEVS